MSLQVCHCCGWSKVTTYQGLRIHQGRMGCTPKGIRVTEPEQQYMWGYVGPPKVQVDLKVDVCSSFKTETKDQSLQVCHCGWTKFTTYQGLRIHQGKMGCTPKGVRIPKKEQYNWEMCWEDEADYDKYPQTKRVNIKKETLPEIPRMSNRRDEYKSSSMAPHRSSHRTTRSKSGQEKLSTHLQVNRPVREHSVAANPEDGFCLKKKNIKRQPLPENTLSGDMKGVWSAERYNDYTVTTVRTKEEPEDWFAAPDVSLQTTAKIKSRPWLQDYSPEMYTETPTASAVRPKKRHQWAQTPSQGMVGKHPPIIHSEPDVQSKDKQRQDQTFSLVNRSAREQPPSPPVVLPRKKDSLSLNINQEESDSKVERSVREQPSSPPVVLPRKKDAPAYVTERSERFSVQEIQNMLQRKNKMREDNSDIKPPGLGSENVLVSLRINSPTTAAITEEKKSSFTPQPEDAKPDHQLQDFPAAEQAEHHHQHFQVNRSVREQLPSPPVVPPKKKDSPLLKINPEISDSESDQEIQDYLQGKKMIVETLKDIDRPVETAHERTNSPTEVSFIKENKSPSTPQPSFRKPTNPKAAHQLQDFSAAEQGTKSVVRHSKIPPVVPPKTKDSALVKVNQSESEITKDTSTPTNITAVADVSATSHKAAQSGLSTGVKVKDLVRRFSVTTAQEKAPPPQEEFREGRKRSQDATRTSTITPTAAAAASKKEDPSSLCQAAQSQFSTGVKVKELVRMLSVQEAAVRPNEKHREEDESSQKEANSAGSKDTKMNFSAEHPSADPTSSRETEQLSGFSSGLKVKDLVQMFAAAAKKSSTDKGEAKRSREARRDGRF
ncbi:muscle M-line assembly protein unc-89-like isoform X2 [Melanotaenia boesemani]|uniref:muscle M-line assembly protein unc-89-like isoform X2 n=1 Tax=Melanotaenia boesemani TaxID=1250792 RepID=UPI001C043D48|nr:muscle M-line assembly protein unc-89-like isoform X2 [Melanotaenia boesemani]